MDPDDDSRSRWVVWRYRYDPERRERRNMIITAVETEDEAWEVIRAAKQQLSDEQRAGTAEPVERISGVHWPAGYRAMVRARRENPSGAGLTAQRDAQSDPAT